MEKDKLQKEIAYNLGCYTISMLGYLELLQQNDLSPEKRQEIINKAVRHCKIALEEVNKLRSSLEGRAVIC